MSSTSGRGNLECLANLPGLSELSWIRRLYKKMGLAVDAPSIFCDSLTVTSYYWKIDGFIDGEDELGSTGSSGWQEKGKVTCRPGERMWCVPTDARQSENSIEDRSRLRVTHSKMETFNYKIFINSYNKIILSSNYNPAIINLYIVSKRFWKYITEKINLQRQGYGLNDLTFKLHSVCSIIWSIEIGNKIESRWRNGKIHNSKVYFPWTKPI